MSTDKRQEYKLLTNRHVKYLRRCLQVIPSSFVAYDSSRLMVLFFALSGIDVLNALDEVKQNEREDIINWIYSLQVLPNKHADSVLDRCGGFRGGTSVKVEEVAKDELSSCYSTAVQELDCGHLAMTYTALTSLIILGDDLRRIDRHAVLQHVKALQCPDGSFLCTSGGSENDMRFLYCATTICYILQDFSTLNVPAAVDYIKRSMSYEGAMGQGLHMEAHGGSTFCAVAALHLMEQLDCALTHHQRGRLVRWLINRQDAEFGGLQGRPNKPADTCYTYWVGGTLKLLDNLNLANLEELRKFVLETQDPITGGLSKHYGESPDGLHTYLGLSGLSILGLDGKDLNPVDPALNITKRALEHLKNLHSSWS